MSKWDDDFNWTERLDRTWDLFRCGPNTATVYPNGAWYVWDPDHVDGGVPYLYSGTVHESDVAVVETAKVVAEALARKVWGEVSRKTIQFSVVREAPTRDEFRRYLTRSGWVKVTKLDATDLTESWGKDGYAISLPTKTWGATHLVSLLTTVATHERTDVESIWRDCMGRSLHYP